MQNPYCISSGREYGGRNAKRMKDIMRERGLTNGAWGTYDQWQDVGKSVRAGQRSWVSITAPMCGGGFQQKPVFHQSQTLQEQSSSLAKALASSLASSTVQSKTEPNMTTELLPKPEPEPTACANTTEERIKELTEENRRLQQALKDQQDVHNQEIQEELSFVYEKLHMLQRQFEEQREAHKQEVQELHDELESQRNTAKQQQEVHEKQVKYLQRQLELCNSQTSLDNLLRQQQVTFHKQLQEQKLRILKDFQLQLQLQEQQIEAELRLEDLSLDELNARKDILRCDTYC